MTTGVITVCSRCDSQRRCECKGAKRHKVPVIRVDALRVPLEAATGNYEDLSVEQLNEVMWDFHAEFTRRLLKRAVQEEHA